MTSEADRQLLLRIAREAIAAHMRGNRPLVPELADVLNRPSGAFVTIHRNGKLRGCIGHIQADGLLGVVVPECAVAAAISDPRFPPVRAADLGDLQVELSLLGPLEPVAFPNDIEIGRHGLLIERGGRRGLLLPQVATEWRWDAETFLAQTCHKAGLPLDAWKHGATLWRFEAEVFGEGR